MQETNRNIDLFNYITSMFCISDHRFALGLFPELQQGVFPEDFRLIPCFLKFFGNEKCCPLTGQLTGKKLMLH